MIKPPQYININITYHLTPFPCLCFQGACKSKGRASWGSGVPRSAARTSLVQSTKVKYAGGVYETTCPYCRILAIPCIISLPQMLCCFVDFIVQLYTDFIALKKFLFICWEECRDIIELWFNSRHFNRIMTFYFRILLIAVCCL